MSMVNELNSELAMAMVNRIKTDKNFNPQTMLAMLRQINLTLRPLSKADRREKIVAPDKSAERGAANRHSH